MSATWATLCEDDEKCQKEQTDTEEDLYRARDA